MELNTFKVDEDGKIYINDLEIPGIKEYEIKSGLFGKHEITLKFSATIDIKPMKDRMNNENELNKCVTQAIEQALKS